MAPAAANPTATRKSRRGTETRQRNCLLNIRLTAEEDARIRRAADEQGVPRAALLRNLVMTHLGAA